MKTQHTPGSWSDDHLSRFERASITGGKLRLVKADGVIVALLPQWLDAPEEAAEARANARLIAAAPDLLEALQAIISDGVHCDVVPHLHRQALAAIAKATGDQL